MRMCHIVICGLSASTTFSTLSHKRQDFRKKKKLLNTKMLICWYPHLVVVGELEYPNDPESYAAGSVATGRVTLGDRSKVRGQTKRGTLVL